VRWRTELNPCLLDEGPLLVGSLLLKSTEFRTSALNGIICGTGQGI
jgi:hypothetical protein